MIVGGKAATNNFKELSAPFLNFGPNIENPAGLGALASMVRPPPLIAPETMAHFDVSLKPSTCDPKNVKAALSVTAVNAVDTKYKVVS